MSSAKWYFAGAAADALFALRDPSPGWQLYWTALCFVSLMVAFKCMESKG